MVDNQALNLRKLSNAIGIGEDIFDKWAAVTPILKAEDEDEPDGDMIYSLGPIVDSEMHEMFGMAKSLSSPLTMTEFLKEAGGKDIQIDINTPGGSVFAAVSMVSQLLRYKGKIQINVVGTCYSAGNFFLSIPDSYRLAYPGTEFMVHRAATVAIGNAKDMEEIARDLRRTDESIAKRMAKVSDCDKEMILSMMDETTFFDATAAMEYGFVDEVYGGEDDDEPEMEDEDTEMEDDDDDIFEASADRILDMSEKSTKIASARAGDLFSFYNQ